MKYAVPGCVCVGVRCASVCFYDDRVDSKGVCMRRGVVVWGVNGGGGVAEGPRRVCTVCVGGGFGSVHCTLYTVQFQK
jgi:hypothetical protein